MFLFVPIYSALNYYFVILELKKHNSYLLLFYVYLPNGAKLVYNLGNNILKLFNILEKLPFDNSKVVIDI